MKINVANKLLTISDALPMVSLNVVNADVALDSSWDNYPVRVIMVYNSATDSYKSFLIYDGKANIDAGCFSGIPISRMCIFGINRFGNMKCSGSVYLPVIESTSAETGRATNIYSEICDSMEDMSRDDS